MVSSRRGLVSLLSAAENVEIALRAAAREPSARIRARAADALAAVGLTEVSDHLVEALSGGQQQRVAVARAIALQPRLLIADEYSAELDSRMRSRIDGLVREIAHDGGTVLLATHDGALAARADATLDLAMRTASGTR